MNAGQLIEILGKFPPETPVLKTNDEGGGYDNIPDTGIFEYNVYEMPVEFDWQAQYADCEQNREGCFKAIVL